MQDQIEIELNGGRGGNGVVSFLREKFRPKGGPDGGDGGDGGPVIVRAMSHLRSLDHLEGVKRVVGAAGFPGRSKDRTGGKGKASFVDVPVGTVVWTCEEDGERTLLTELTRDRAEAIVAYPGTGGFGNARFATSTNQEPLLAIGGEPGERRVVSLEVKLLADVGLVGAPNAGKSTLLSVVSHAKPKIADYPFTTLAPVLGVVLLDDRTVVMLDIPGLIEGAHRGRGLGLEFLRHCERAIVLIQLVDGMAENLAADYQAIADELALYGGGLERKTRIVAVTKMDIPEAKSRFTEQRKALAAVAGVEPMGIASVTGEGIPGLIARLASIVPPPGGEDGDGTTPQPPRLRRPNPRPKVVREEDAYSVSCPAAERILEAVSLSSWRARLQFHRELERLGVIEALERAGAGRDDTVRIADFEFVWE